MKKIKSMKGITLIALVVTIIILIILAGVSISLVLGENGIITKAKDARSNFAVAANEEKTGLDGLYAEMNEKTELQENFTGELIRVTEININGDSYAYFNTTTTLTATVLPENATNKSIIWSSSDTTKATVDQNGVVRGVATSGTVTISATSAENNEIVASKEIRVSDCYSYLKWMGSPSGVENDNTWVFIPRNTGNHQSYIIKTSYTSWQDMASSTALNSYYKKGYYDAEHKLLIIEDINRVHLSGGENKDYIDVSSTPEGPKLNEIYPIYGGYEGYTFKFHVVGTDEMGDTGIFC